jgi:hypothetical protein
MGSVPSQTDWDDTASGYVEPTARREVVPPSRKPQHGQHPPGPAFLRAIRIVVLQVTSGADLVIVNLFDPAVATLAHDLRREIDFVVRRTDAGTQLNDEIGRFDPEPLSHEVDCAEHDS